MKEKHLSDRFREVCIPRLENALNRLCRELNEEFTGQQFILKRDTAFNRVNYYDPRIKYNRSRSGSKVIYENLKIMNDSKPHHHPLASLMVYPERTLLSLSPSRIYTKEVHRVLRPIADELDFLDRMYAMELDS